MGPVPIRISRRAQTSPEGWRRPGNGPARQVLVLLPALLVTVVVALLGAATASAHAQFTGSDPTEAALLQQLPAAAVMSYSEDIAPQFVETAVIAPDGTTVPTSATVDGLDVSVDLSSADVLALAGQGGTWQVVARVVSADGHPVEHTTSFTLSEAAPEATPGSATAAPPGSATAAAAATVTDPAAATDPATALSVDPAAALTDGFPRWMVGLAAVAAVAAAGAALLVQLRRRPPQD